MNQHHHHSTPPNSSPMPPPLPTTPTLGAPQPWPPPPTSSDTKVFKDCTQPICTITCTQWCKYLPLPPPPPFDDDDGSSSSSRISPLMAALIAILAAAFILLFYYTVISRLCRRRRHNRRQLSSHDPILDPEARLDPMVQDPTRPGTGLDDSFIRQITVFKYRRSDGLVDGTECAVCLNEFREEESLRLMPNCEHAFHIPCIDTWLKSQSNCPLCRATMNPAPPPNPGPGQVGTVTSVVAAAMRVERGGDAVLVIRELEDDQLIDVNVCHERSEEEREEIGEERENGDPDELRKADRSVMLWQR